MTDSSDIKSFIFLLLLAEMHVARFLIKKHLYAYVDSARSMHAQNLESKNFADSRYIKIILKQKE